jgi:hypothetical protein
MTKIKPLEPDMSELRERIKTRITRECAVHGSYMDADTLATCIMVKITEPIDDLILAETKELVEALDDVLSILGYGSGTIPQECDEEIMANAKRVLEKYS